MQLILLDDEKIEIAKHYSELFSVVSNTKVEFEYSDIQMFRLTTIYAMIPTLATPKIISHPP